jgi:hypothetical protein
MHDTLEYISKEPIHRRHHHGNILFGLYYAFSENFVLPLSHDEVVHGKRSILGRMPGDEWQRFANLRAYYGFMFGHPGKKLMFMGCEFGQDWNEPHHSCRGTSNGRTISACSSWSAISTSHCATPALPADCDAGIPARRTPPQRVRVAARQRPVALRGGRQLHARGPAQLRPRAVRRPMARSAQHRRCSLWRQ